MAFVVKEAYRVGDSIQVVLADGKNLRFVEYDWDKEVSAVGEAGPKRFPTFASFRSGVAVEVAAQLSALNSDGAARSPVNVG